MTITNFDEIHSVNQNNGRLQYQNLGSSITHYYERLDHSLSVSDHIAWVRLLNNKRDGKPFFFHQPWELLRKLYRDEGDLDAVREINWAYDKAKADFQQQTATGMRKAFLWLRNVLYDRIAGHGHKLFRVVPWIGATMVLFLLWAAFAYHQGSIVPTSERVYTNTCYLNPQTSCTGWTVEVRAMAWPPALQATPALQIPDGYPAFHSVLYTLDTFIPFADLHQERYWTVTDDGPWGEATRIIFSIFIGLGGILSAIFAAAMLSLIRKS